MPATLGDLDFQIFSFDVFSVPDTCKDECGNLVDQEKRALIDAVCQMDQMIGAGCAGYANSNRDICTKWTMNLNTGTLHALYYGRNATHKDYSAVTSNDLNACEVSLGDHTLGNNIVKSASAIPVVNGSDNFKIPMENWTQVYSMGYFDKEDFDLGREHINYLFSRSANLIIKRLCQNCADSHREIYYRYFANPPKLICMKN